VLFHFVKPRREQSIPLTGIVIASLGLVIASGDMAAAAGARSERSVASVAARTAGEPVMAIVSLRRQQITIYDAQGWTLRAPVSTGQNGRETPAGIFSVIQKEAEHYSNLYDDASMPHMQRLTWSGIALHGGVVPGHPASHGCIRMPYGFAERLFDTTSLGMRVIVAPADVAPVPIVHPALFQPKADAGAVAAARAAEAEQATKKANEARLVVFKVSREAAQAMVPVRVAENLKLRAEAQLEASERALASASSIEDKQKAEDARAKAAALAVELSARLAAAKAELQPKLDAVGPAREALVAAEAARAAADEEARKTARDLEPMSVFISRRTQHLYVRQGFEPILDVPVTIRDPERAIGTHVYTATEHAGGDLNMRWSVVSLVRGQSDAGVRDTYGSAPGDGRGNAEAQSDDLSGATEALDRVSIPKETLDRIADTISPRSSLIISDEALSSETGQGTEFVVLLSGEPQGGIKNRRRGPEVEVRYRRPGGAPRWNSGFAGQYSNW
jgi:L,D-transpeptidase catalytic domain